MGCFGSSRSFQTNNFCCSSASTGTDCVCRNASLSATDISLACFSTANTRPIKSTASRAISGAVFSASTNFRRACDLSGAHDKSHVRRKFYDLEVAHKSPVAAEALERIAGLYAIEREIRGRPPDERREVRNTRSRPLLESLKQWLEETLGKLSSKSDTALASRDGLGRWEALLHFCDDGNIEIDNNAAERALRVVALGRNHAQPEIMHRSTVSTVRIASTLAGRGPIRPLMNCA